MTSTRSILSDMILGRMHETSVSGTIENQSGRIVDRAVPNGRPISPDYRPASLGASLPLSDLAWCSPLWSPT